MLFQRSYLIHVILSMGYSLVNVIETIFFTNFRFKLKCTLMMKNLLHNLARRDVPYHFISKTVQNIHFIDQRKKLISISKPHTACLYLPSRRIAAF